MKIRSLRPEFFTDRKMSVLSPHARLLYQALWCIADDEGRGRYLPKTIEGEAFPHEGVDIHALLGELVDASRVVVYEHNGEEFFHVPTFGTYQKPNRIVLSKLPVPPEQTQDVHSASAVFEQCEDTADAHAVVGEVEGDVEVEGAGDIPAPAAETSAVGTSLALVESSPTATRVEHVFHAWQQSTGRTKAVLDPKRRKVILAALKLYPPEDLVDAVRGWRHVPHNRGENDKHQVYNDLELLLRDTARIERFRDAERNGTPIPVSSNIHRLAELAGGSQ